MTPKRPLLVLAVFASLLLSGVTPALAQETLKIGAPQPMTGR